VLTEKQTLLYFCLRSLAGTMTSLAQIAKVTGISIYTLKSCLKKLRAYDVIIYGGRCNVGGHFGFTAQVTARPIALRGDKSKVAKQLQRLDYAALPVHAAVDDLPVPTAPASAGDHPMVHPMEPPMVHPMEASCSSSMNTKETLLHGLLLDGAFQHLAPHALLPYLDQFDTTEALQDFLDMTNACITASKNGHGKPIHNPQGFLFAQLRAGYIHPPEDYKSRRLRAQEARNRQLQDELETLQRLHTQEMQLRLEIFQATLRPADLARLEAEVQRRIEPNGLLSPSFQVPILRDQILHEWFEQGGPPGRSGERRDGDQGGEEPAAP
jgi:hypothetical protein